jgi:ATP-dependent DNA helicase RecG
MDKEALINLINAHEWKEVEFKEAQRNVPKSAYETVSAFANTEGGHLVFGVKKDVEDFEIVGVLDVDGVQNSFLSTLRQPDKLSVIVDVQEDLQTYNDAQLLIFYVPESKRSDKPVYLNQDIRRSFIRKGGCDVKCSVDERNRFLIDAATERYDSQGIELDVKSCFEKSSINWYRNTYEGRPGNRSYSELSDLDFLAEMGLLVEISGIRRPSRAAVLLFGTNAVFRQLLPRPLVDCQLFLTDFYNADTIGRWDDRLVHDENLIRTWQSLVGWYQKLLNKPFNIDPTSLQRDEAPPDYRAYREAIVNLLIHQDYSDHTRIAEMRHYSDHTIFKNPGDAFANESDLLEPGPKEVRNPHLVTAFRRIGLSEQAGWGLRDIFRNWQTLGYIPPIIKNDKSRKSFELLFKRHELITDEQIMFHASLGVRLSYEQAKAFALVCRQDKVTLSELKAVTGLSGPDTIQIIQYLVTQSLIKKISDSMYTLADHLKERLIGKNIDLGTDQVDSKKNDLVSDQVKPVTTDLVTDQVKPLTNLNDVQWKIVMKCDVPMKMLELMDHVGVKHRNFFKKTHLQPLLDGGIIQMTNPDKPRASNQKYVLTETGVQLKIRQKEKLKQ